MVQGHGFKFSWKTLYPAVENMVTMFDHRRKGPTSVCLLQWSPGRRPQQCEGSLIHGISINSSSDMANGKWWEYINIAENHLVLYGVLLKIYLQDFQMRLGCSSVGKGLA